MMDKPKFQGEPKNPHKPHIQDSLLALFKKYQIVEANGSLLEVHGFEYKFTYPDNSLKEKGSTTNGKDITSWIKHRSL